MKSNVMIDKKIAEKAKESVEKHIRKKYEGIETVEFIRVKRSSLGGLMVEGIVNGNGGFSASVDELSGCRVGSIGAKKRFPQLKEEYLEEDS
ncbi:hypothetical protein [Numidum massiliense]|uniref:hypothetical protein n=1 Tax=Numidum massiliense TaxID=1522315 RepID=UPI0006D53781|nr:hypothetical protein [Numidum massiliense]